MYILSKSNRGIEIDEINMSMLIVSDICQDEKIRDEENLGTKNNSENEEETNPLQSYQ